MDFARPTTLRLGGLALVFALAGCNALQPPPQTSALLAARPASLAPQIELSKVAFFPQTPYHCGPAALATALSWAGLPAAPEALVDAVFLPSRAGTLQLEMLGGARRQGGLPLVLRGELATVFRELADHRPVVVLQNLGLDIAPMWHYAVVVGYDIARGEIILRSGQTKRLVMSLATFERTWARAQYWAMVVVAPGQLPATVDAAGALQSALAFERVASAQNSAKVYQSMLERWPEHEVAALGLGNAQRRAGDLQAAAHTFEMLGLRSGSASAWINLAWVYVDLDRVAEAVQAAERAVARAQMHETRWLARAQEVFARSTALQEAQRERQGLVR